MLLYWLCYFQEGSNRSFANLSHDVFTLETVSSPAFETLTETKPVTFATWLENQRESLLKFIPAR